MNATFEWLGSHGDVGQFRSFQRAPISTQLAPSGQVRVFTRWRAGGQQNIEEEFVTSSAQIQQAVAYLNSSREGVVGAARNTCPSGQWNDVSGRCVSGGVFQLWDVTNSRWLGPMWIVSPRAADAAMRILRTPRLAQTPPVLRSRSMLYGDVGEPSNESATAALGQVFRSLPARAPISMRGAQSAIFRQFPVNIPGGHIEYRCLIIVQQGWSYSILPCLITMAGADADEVARLNGWSNQPEGAPRRAWVPGASVVLPPRICRWIQDRFNRGMSAEQAIAGCLTEWSINQMSPARPRAVGPQRYQPPVRSRSMLYGVPFAWLGAPNIPLETGKTYRVMYTLPGDCAAATDADVGASLTPSGWTNVAVRQRDQFIGACRVLVEQTWPDAPAELDVAQNPFQGPLAASQARVIQVLDVATNQTLYDAATGQTPPQTPRCRADQVLQNNVCVDRCTGGLVWDAAAGVCKEPTTAPPPVDPNQPPPPAAPSAGTRRRSSAPLIVGLAVLGITVALVAVAAR